MTRILGISGSLREGSFNTALLRAAGGRNAAGRDSRARDDQGIPLYDGDVEAARASRPPSWS